jgi:Cys-tRNA(Pro)/Cys-tRNA(Cys) deacylase
LKALAKLSGDRKMELAPLKELQPLTGYIRGGVTALACKKEYPVYVDETAILFDLISVSAGVRGTQIVLKPEDYLRLVRAIIGEIAKAKTI